MIALKEIYDESFFSSLNNALNKSYKDFDKIKFLKLIYDDEWKNRELKNRMSYICISLNKVLTGDYRKDLLILKKVAKEMKADKSEDGNKMHDKYFGLSAVIFANYVEIFGLNDFDVSMDALEFFTPYGSSEFAVREFFVKYPNETLEYFIKWSKSDNYHVRRLASEGSRPRLPWGIALQDLKKDPKPIIPILETLKDDESDYVRRSVANNLNDICKDNPDIALKLGESWLKEGGENIVKLVKHGLRTLLKSSNIRALGMFGYINIKNPVESFDLQKLIINIGEDLSFNFDLCFKDLVKIRVEYAIYFLRKDKKFSRKVFQIMGREFDKGRYSFSKKHSFRKITTRKYYPGEHKIALIINGQEGESKDFTLKS